MNEEQEPQKAKRKPGRPPNSPTLERPHSVAHVSRCPACGSTDREKYQRATEQAYSGTDPQGNPYTHIIRRWTKCAKCGQARIDRHYENRI